MFFKKREKEKRQVVCPIPVILEIMQDTIDIDAGLAEFLISLDGQRHNVGFYSDLDWKGNFINPIFYLDEQEFSTFESFKAEAVLDGELFARKTNCVEVVEADNGAFEFPWYDKLEDYVVQEDV